METLLDRFVLPHAPFLIAFVILFLVGQVLKKTLWAKERAARLPWVAFGRSTMVIHPVIAGAVFGLIPSIPTSGPWAGEYFWGPMYYAGAGAAASLTVATAKAIFGAKKTDDYMRDLMGSMAPPSMPEKKAR